MQTSLRRGGGNRRWAAVVACLLGVFSLQAADPRSVTLVVLDPLAKELACACVQGFGQRDYRKLAARLQSDLKTRVAIEFSDDLAETLQHIGSHSDVVIVGERSVVEQGAQRARIPCRAFAELTDREGSTSYSGLFVARRNDTARSLPELGGRTVLFGLAESDALLAAARTALDEAQVKPKDAPVRRTAGNEAALDVIDSSSSPPPVAVIPDYTLRLLEGCGSIQKGDLRVVGRTKPVPFVTAFVAAGMAGERSDAIVQSLLAVHRDPGLLKLLESRSGFRPIPDTPQPVTAPAAPRVSRESWPDWRGARRDGRVAHLPSRLPESARVIWKRGTLAGGLAGLSVAEGRLVLAERDLDDTADVYRCLHADTGETLWRVTFPAAGTLDYGQSPRAAPVLSDQRAYLLGAFGELRCVEVESGKLIWKRHLPREFEAELPTWGLCSTPLLIDGLLIVNPGAPQASLAALDPRTGQTRWTVPGAPAAYASFIGGTFGGRRQIIGYDERTLGGWDPATGRRLWRLTPPNPGDFNVPTPIATPDGVVVSTENNGTRLYRFDSSGRIIPQPVAGCSDRSADTTTPVLTAGRLFEANQGQLRCLDLGNALRPVWSRTDDAVGDHSTLLADDERVLVITLGGELILFDARDSTGSVLSRLRLFEDDVEVYSHPALVGTRLFVRGGPAVACFDLAVN